MCRLGGHGRGWLPVRSARRSRIAAIDHHALATGLARAFLVASGIAVVNLAITIAAIRVRRADLTGNQPRP